jgi:hypothetical protein
VRRWANPAIHAAHGQPDGQVDAQSGQALNRRSRQAPQRAATEQLRITERLAARVKGLTTVFCILLLTNPARTRRPAGFQGKARLRETIFRWRRAHEFFKR